ncbi:MAG: hypothetical protein BMS9Abin22_518 [Gammaproteobacteria bacterium]|nr:MAG: hypothetical protein BMS9Abin22_518 [Gammaproteobacteria bacterium]
MRYRITSVVMAVFMLIASATWVTQAGGNDHQPMGSAASQHVSSVDDGGHTYQCDPTRDYDHCSHLDAHFVGHISADDSESPMISHRWLPTLPPVQAGIFPHTLLRPPRALLS